MDPLAAVLIAVLFFASVYERRASRVDHAEERREWEAERAELLTRIQRPEITPLRPGPFTPPPPPRDAAALAKIGTVAREDSDGKS